MSYRGERALNALDAAIERTRARKRLSWCACRMAIAWVWNGQAWCGGCRRYLQAWEVLALVRGSHHMHSAMSYD